MIHYAEEELKSKIGNTFSPDIFDVIIVGGGLAGLTAAILLSKNDKKILLLEKKEYPFHKVCGEYISNEILPFLQSIGFDPFFYDAAKISKLRISTPAGKNIYAGLDLGGFGLSRFVLDTALYELAKKNGADILTKTKVTDIHLRNDHFEVETKDGMKHRAKLVIGSYGKRDVLDKKLHRHFVQTHTGYMGIKYHVKLNYPVDEVGLDNFENGYCGIVKIEDDKYNLCYLYKRNLKVQFKNPHELEENVLFKNPVIKNIFSQANFISEEPEAINEISFAPKKLIEEHILMCGDSAGLITPLCGNGMSMAIHAAKLLSENILESGILEKKIISIENRKQLEEEYKHAWKKHFSNRLFWGRTIQSFFGNPTLTGFALNSIHALRPLESFLIRKTHGQVV
ncbi:MAG: NAD(P)/FAD-dependent oxidoreductase [Fimbriimonadaceae bacterium]|nr:NAD(P)/FAD-dependent oxidoreductase [Chitinophagales bacterium]